MWRINNLGLLGTKSVTTEISEFADSCRNLAFTPFFPKRHQLPHKPGIPFVIFRKYIGCNATGNILHSRKLLGDSPAVNVFLKFLGPSKLHITREKRRKKS